MKRVPLLALIALLFTAVVFGQKPTPASSDSFQLGTRTVRIPAPAGFSEIISRFDHIAGRLIGTEDPNNDMLTSHLPTSSLPKFEANQKQDLDIYTKVSVSKRAKTMDITPEIFASVAASAEEQMDSLLDPNGPLLKKAEGNTSKGLSELWGNDTTIKINEPKSLGVFDRGDNVHSSLLFMNIDINGKKYSILNTISFVRINQRLVFVYTYKMNPEKTDIEMLTNLAKKWTASIIAANK